MKITIDTDESLIIVHERHRLTTLPMATPEAFELVSKAWLRAGWDNKHVYTFTWLGRPIIQLPEDIVRIQEIIYAVQPDVIVETGVAHGGSLVLYASLCRAMGKGRVVGIEVDIRSRNKAAILAHPLAPTIELVEGSSIDPSVVAQVRSLVRPGERVFVVLDSLHSAEHVYAELRAYGPLVSSGSYVIAMDGIMEEVAGAPRTMPDWTWNNPRRAAIRFAEEHPEFVLEEPKFRFNESPLSKAVTYAPGGFLRRR